MFVRTAVGNCMLLEENSQKNVLIAPVLTSILKLKIFLKRLAGIAESVILVIVETIT